MEFHAFYLFIRLKINHEKFHIILNNLRYLDQCEEA